MRVYFDKEGLIESREFYTDKKIPYSLFSSISSVYPFELIHFRQGPAAPCGNLFYEIYGSFKT